MRKLEIREVQDMLLELMKVVHNFMLENQIEYYLLGGSALGAIRHEGFIPWDDDIDIGIKRNDYEKFLMISHKFDDNYEVVNYHCAKNCDFGLTRIYIKNTYIKNPLVSKTKLDKRLYFDIFPLDNVPDDNKLLYKFENQILKKKKLIQYIDNRKTSRSTIKNFVRRMISWVLNPFRYVILSSFDKLMQKYRNCNTKRICSLCSQYSFSKQVMLKTIYGEPKLHKFEDVELFVPQDTKEYLSILFGQDYMQIPSVEKRKKSFEIYLTVEE